MSVPRAHRRVKKNGECSEEQMEIIEDHPPLNNVAMFDVMGPCWPGYWRWFQGLILSQRQTVRMLSQLWGSLAWELWPRALLIWWLPPESMRCYWWRLECDARSRTENGRVETTKSHEGRVETDTQRDKRDENKSCHEHGRASWGDCVLPVWWPLGIFPSVPVSLVAKSLIWQNHLTLPLILTT